MSGYFSFERSKKFCYLFDGDLSDTGAEIAVVLNTLADLTSSRYDYNHRPATENKQGEILAVHHVGPFFRKGSIITKATTTFNPETNFSGGEEFVGDISLRCSGRSIGKRTYFQIQDYMMSLEKM